MTMAAFIINPGDLIEYNRTRKHGYSNYMEAKQWKQLISTIWKCPAQTSVLTIKLDKQIILTKEYAYGEHKS